MGSSERICKYTVKSIELLRILPDNQPSEQTNLDVVKKLLGEDAGEAKVKNTLGPMVKRTNRVAGGFVIKFDPPEEYKSGKILEDPASKPYKVWIKETSIPFKLLEALNSKEVKVDQVEVTSNGSQFNKEPTLQEKFNQFAISVKQEVENPERVPKYLEYTKNRIQTSLAYQIADKFIDVKLKSLPNRMTECIRLRFGEEDFNYLFSCYYEDEINQKTLIWVCASLWECWKDENPNREKDFYKFDIQNKIFNVLKKRGVKLSQVLAYIYNYFTS